MGLEFARSLSGHDKNQIYMVIKRAEGYVYLANGSTKPLAAPKKKSEKHIQIIRRLPAEAAECLSRGLSDETIRRAIRLYQSSIAEP